MIKVGITGGIGSGKTVVSFLFELFRVPVYIADTESKRLTVSSPVIRYRLTDLLGEEVYTHNRLNKKYLASRIFGDAQVLKEVNAIIHPEVNRDFQEWSERREEPVVATESAILFESGFDALVDIRLMVYAPFETRIRRAMLRENISREEVERRIRNQMPDELKKEKSDYVIYNDGIQALIPQVDDFLKALRNGRL